MRFTSKLAAAAALAVAAGGLALAAPASASTLTCTNTNNALTSPIGCGGLQLFDTAKGTLDMANLGGSYWNSKVGVELDSQSDSAEDWTVYAVNGSTTDGPGFLGEYVAMATPLGKVASFTYGTSQPSSCSITPPSGSQSGYPAAGCTFTVGTDVYCLSVENLNNGPEGALRWHAVLRNCDSNGTFTEGNDLTGTAKVVNSVSSAQANAYQVWAPVTGQDGLLMVNDTLSHGYKDGNTPYVLDDSGFGGAGTQLLAYPENDGINQEWSILGCTAPVTLLDTSYASCP
jgi:hypothetical protein